MNNNLNIGNKVTLIMLKTSKILKDMTKCGKISKKRYITP